MKSHFTGWSKKTLAQHITDVNSYHTRLVHGGQYVANPVSEVARWSKEEMDSTHRQMHGVQQ